MKQLFSVIEVRPLHDGAFLGHGPNFEIEVEFPEGYDHLESADSPIEEAVVSYLNKEGWDCNGAYYIAQAEDGTGEERINIKMKAVND